MEEYEIGESEYWFYGDRILQNRNPTNCDLSGSINPKYSVSVSDKRIRKKLFEELLGSFNVFSRQRDALETKASKGAKYRVFSFESPDSKEGQRRFLVTTVERFWQWYENRQNLSFYELIPDETPCRLYFDLEFYRATNANVDEKKLINDFNCCVVETMQNMFNIDLIPNQQMIILDSSTSTKFSEHVIVHFHEKYFFSSNVSMKPFILMLEKNMISSNRGIVWNKDGTRQIPLFDVGVYTRNRNFRLYLSSKIGKNNPLILSCRCDFYQPGTATKKQIFLDSLVVPSVRLEDINIINSINTCTSINEVSQIDSGLLSCHGSFDRECSNSVVLSGQGFASPYPFLDQRWKETVSIRMWKLVKDESKRICRIIYYVLANCRYCFNIGREHKSNGTYWTVDLEKLIFYQKCFDIDCRGASSNHFPLPNFVRQSIPAADDVSQAHDYNALQTEAKRIVINLNE
ncbi:unnamed protein product [Dracunculus medinensis]|uniref:DNA-directed primase/polymerase protein n=1 Tax=Dracunculus medinensis TaxID=318479 RepID=A0A0N4U674_DRAME|nr:unnamed protein product [Dracunculus medinensis]